MPTPAKPVPFPYPDVRTDEYIPAAILIDNSVYAIPVRTQILDTVKSFMNAVLSDPYASSVLDTCMIGFGGSAEIIAPFCSADNLHVSDDIKFSGKADLIEAMNLTLDKFITRKIGYESAGVKSRKPWIIIVTSGITDNSVSEACEFMHRMETELPCTVIPVVVGDNNDCSILKMLRPDGLILHADKTDFTDLFGFPHSSIGTASRVLLSPCPIFIEA